MHFELSPWQRSHSSWNVKVPVLAGAPVRGCPHKKTYNWLQGLGKEPIDGPTSLNQHYFLPAYLFSEAFFLAVFLLQRSISYWENKPPPHHGHPTPPCSHHQAWHSQFSSQLKTPGFWPLRLLYQLVNINHIFIIDTFITGLPPSRRHQDKRSSTSLLLFSLLFYEWPCKVHCCFTVWIIHHCSKS